MKLALGLPGEGQSGRRLIRRSIVTLARKRIMLGHVQPTTIDMYAVSDPAHLGRALARVQKRLILSWKNGGRGKD